jgi:hypothetical protein
VKVLKFVVVLLCLIIFSCDLDNDTISFSGTNCVDGQGVVVSESRVLNDFNGINSSIYGDILITQGPLEDVILEAQQNILDVIETNVVNGELIITLNRCIDIFEPIKVHITIPDIQNLTLTGVGEFVSQNDFSSANLDITLTGTGDFDLKGTVNNLDILLTGVGDVNAFDLISDVCNVNVTGVGDIEVFANEELNVILSGVGNVFYMGNPDLTINITGSGNVIDSN